MHQAFISLPDEIAQSLVSSDPSLTAKTDILPILWENLKPLLFATVMSLQGVITTLMFSNKFQNGNYSKCVLTYLLEYSSMSLTILEILQNLAFVSARFGYSAFDEWNFVYLASIDLLSANPLQAALFIDRHIPGTSQSFFAYMRSTYTTSCRKSRCTILP